ncbi:MAG: hypothetical protein JWQ75_1246 [Pseudarthrobacter sp.]|nr:hypothetical protein [Pseudarthrobacter sp.]
MLMASDLMASDQGSQLGEFILLRLSGKPSTGLLEPTGRIEETNRFLGHIRPAADSQCFPWVVP